MLMLQFKAFIIAVFLKLMFYYKNTDGIDNRNNEIIDSIYSFNSHTSSGDILPAFYGTLSVNTVFNGTIN
jgi:hypothetical protein